MAHPSGSDFPEPEVPTLARVIAEAQRNGRVCPQPRQWHLLYEVLPGKQRKGDGWEPSPPLILAAWWDTPDLPKILRLQEHIEWAASHGCLAEVYAFLKGLREEEWHHVGGQGREGGRLPFQE